MIGGLISGGRLNFLDDMFDKFDKMFDDIWSNHTNNKLIVPAVDIVESDDKISVHMELPGIDTKDLKAEIKGDILTVSGEKKVRCEGKHGRYRECAYGRFERSVKLPSFVDQNSVVAEYADGVLSINFNKTPDATTKRINITIK
ncbi:MAG: Hsp20/alpha crystallin family protein [Nitrososphaerales archaeon]